MRTATITRKTAETDILLELNLDGTGKADVQTGVGFMDHMLTLLAVHSGFDLRIRANGDTWVDDHNTTEDLGICLGQAFRQAIGDKAGIARYGFMILPMDEALVMSEVTIRDAQARALHEGLLADERGDDVESAEAAGEDACILAAVDISGRDLLAIDLPIPTQKVGTFDTELVEEFWLAFVRNANITLHIRELAGRNSHHIIECTFKCVARALRQAVKVDAQAAAAGVVPSSKGTLSL